VGLERGLDLVKRRRRFALAQRGRAGNRRRPQRSV
jgi:hypothetical protein